MQISLVTSSTELQQILDLQERNLVTNINDEEKQSQGFVTLQHTLADLQAFQEIAPSVIIKEEERVIAYALTMPRECSEVVPALQSMFTSFDSLMWQNKPLNDYRFYVMGQICIDKEHRGKGLFERLYQGHRHFFGRHFDCIVTEIATRNLRSMRAHEKVGFKVIHVYRDQQDEWAVVLWNWK